MTERTSLERRVEVRLMQTHPKDAALAVESLEPAHASALFAAAEPEISATVLAHMVSGAAAAAVQRLDADLARDILNEMAADDVALVLRRLPQAERDGLIERLNPVRRVSVTALLDHPENTAGALMDPDEIVLPDDITVREARSRLMEDPAHVHYNLYIVDREQRLVGVMNQSELMAAEPNQRLAGVMSTATLRIPGRSDLPSLLGHEGWQRVSALPVVDKDGRFLGVIRYRKLRRLEETHGDRRSAAPASTAQSLGELYATAFGALIETFSAAVDDRPPHERGPS